MFRRPVPPRRRDAALALPGSGRFVRPRRRRLLIAFFVAATGVRAQGVSSPPTAASRAPAAAPAPGLAASAAARPAAPAVLQPVEITAVRPSDAEERRRSTASKIVVGRDEIERFGDASVNDVRKRPLGVTIQGRPGRGAAIRLRGLGSGYTPILLDGQRVQPDCSLDSLTPEQIERIEILRAPTAETGARAIAGTTNIVTREDFARRVNELRMTAYAENGRLQPSVSWTRNEPIGPFIVNLSATAYALNRKTDSTTTTDDLDLASGTPTLAQREDVRSTEQRHGVNLSGRLQRRAPQGGDSIVLMPLVVAGTGTTARSSRLAQAAGVAPAPYDASATDGDGSSALLRLNGTWNRRLEEGGRVETRLGAGQARTITRRFRSETLGGAAAHTLDDRTDSVDRNVVGSAKFVPVFGATTGMRSSPASRAKPTGATTPARPRRRPRRPTSTCRPGSSCGYEPSPKEVDAGVRHGRTRKAEAERHGDRQSDQDPTGKDGMINRTVAPSTIAVPVGKAFSSRADTAFFGHPAGLGWLAFCELWERFSYYGMQMLLGLYLSKHLFLPENIGHVAGLDAVRVAVEQVLGPRTPLQLGALIAGLYAGLVYFTPLFGGLVADRLLGRTRTVVLGAGLMALGHFLMAFEASFLPAIACLVVGVGLFKGNIAAQVGALYTAGDKRNASAFQIFLLAVQVAVVAAPLVCGTLGEKKGFDWGFGAAGVGMLIGLCVYLAARPWLPPEPPRAAVGSNAGRPPMNRAEWGRVALLVGILPVLMLSVVGNQQFNLGFTLWSDKHMDLLLFGWQMPVTWLQGVDAFVSTGTMLLSLAFWRWWATHRQEPDELMKIAIGSLIAAGGPGLMAIAGSIVDTTHGRVGVGWTLAYTVVNDLGFANILAIGLALYSRVAPRQIAGLVIGVYYLHLFLGNSFVGWLAGFMDTMPNRDFWLVHAALVASAGVLLWGVRRVFGHLLAPGAILGRESMPS